MSEHLDDAPIPQEYVDLIVNLRRDNKRLRKALEKYAQGWQGEDLAREALEK